MMRINKFNLALFFMVVCLSQISFGYAEPLPQTIARLMVVVKHAKHSTPTAEISALVSSEAVSLFKQGKATAPVAELAVSILLGETNPAVARTLSELVKAGANPSLMASVGQRAGMNKQEVFVALLEGGVDPVDVTTSAAVGGNLKSQNDNLAGSLAGNNEALITPCGKSNCQ